MVYHQVHFVGDQVCERITSSALDQAHLNLGLWFSPGDEATVILLTTYKGDYIGLRCIIYLCHRSASLGGKIFLDF